MLVVTVGLTGALEWIDKARALGKELDVYKTEAVRLDKVNERLQKENNRLRLQVCRASVCIAL